MNFRKIFVIALCFFAYLGWAKPLSHQVFHAPLPDNIIINKKARVDSKQFLFSYDITSAQQYSRVYIDADHDPSTGFPQGGLGANYLIENDTLYRHMGSGWNWEKVKDLCNTTGNFKQWLLQRSDVVSNHCEGVIEYLYQVESTEGTSTALKMSLNYPKTKDCPQVEEQKIAVPAYFAPCAENGCNWDQVLKAAPTASIAIINPESGPGTTKIGAYAEQIMRARNAGVHVLGYVATMNGTRSLELVKSEIDKYYDWYGVDGIFMGQGERDCGTAAYYQDIKNYVKAKGGAAQTILNFGASVEECHIDSADILLTFESEYHDYLNNWHPMGWELKYPASHFLNLIHDVPEDKLAEVIALTRQNHAGWVYITSDQIPNPWDTLTPYWQQEVDLVSQK